MTVKKILSLLLAVLMISILPTAVFASAPILSENFDTDLSSWTVSNTTKIALSDKVTHSGDKALMIDNSINGEISAVYSGAASVGNNVYAFWFHDTDPSLGAMMFDLTGVNSSGSAVKEKTMFGVKHNAYQGYYIGGNTSGTGVARTEGWHFVVVDVSNAGKVTVYLDGKLTNVNNSTSGQPASVTGMRFFHTWTNAAVKHYIDDLKVYSSYADVPLYQTAVINSIKFESGTDAKNAAGIVKTDGNITFTFKEDMAVPAESNFALLSKASTSESDADYTADSFEVVSADKTSVTLKVSDLKSLTKYRLAFNGLKTEAGKDVENDFIEFTASANVNAGSGPVLSEDFESSDFISTDANGTSTWLASASNYTFAKDNVHDGKQSLGYLPSSTHKPISYRGSVPLGNYAYEFWFYDGGGANDTAMISIIGNNSDGDRVLANSKYSDSYDEALYFGCKIDAYKGNYVVGSGSNSGIARTKGWHHVVMDLSVPGKFSIYIDGKAANNANNANTSIVTVTGITINSKKQANAETMYIDSLKAYYSYDDVPKYRGSVMTGIKLASGADVNGAEGVVKNDGNITFSFKESINVPDETNFTLLKRDITSESDADYTDAQLEIVEASDTSVTVKVSDMESDKTYRLGFSGLKTEARKNIADDFVVFSTGTDVNSSKAFIKSYGFTDLSGNPVTAYQTGSLKLKAEFQYRLEGNFPVVLFCMLYKVENGKLKHAGGSFASTVLNASSNSTPVLECAAVEIPETGEYILKGFLWSGLDTKQVIGEHIEIKE